MNLIKDNIEDMLIKANYNKTKEYDDELLNDFLNYWNFFENNETDIQNLFKESIDMILYSKYYWCMRFKERYMQLYSFDSGIEQQQFKLIEEIENRLNYVDWNIIKCFEDKIINEEILKECSE